MKCDKCQAKIGDLFYFDLNRPGFPKVCPECMKEEK